MKNSIITAALSVLAATSMVNADQLVIKGSDTLGAKLVPQLAESFKAKNADVSFNIAAEGSSTGFAALLDETADIGMSSRGVKPTEQAAAAAKGFELKETVVGWDGMGVIVNAGNPLTSISKKDVERIFTGDVTDWSAVGGNPGKISIYTRNTSSGTYSDFKELAMSKRDYAESAQKMAGNEQIASEVAKNDAGIGYVGLAYLKTPGIKVLAVDSVEPTAENIRNRKYAFARPTYYYTAGEAKGAAQSFIEFTLSDEGQQIVENVGFVRVK